MAREGGIPVNSPPNHPLLRVHTPGLSATPSQLARYLHGQQTDAGAAGAAHSCPTTAACAGMTLAYSPRVCVCACVGSPCAGMVLATCARA